MEKVEKLKNKLNSDKYAIYLVIWWLEKIVC